jgi:glyceraldehyde 3-phosphate dehydrogenase
VSAGIGINGFGRMGRLALRAAWDWPDLRIAHINEVKGGPRAAAHLLEFDSVHGRWDREVGAAPGAILIGKERVTFSSEADPGRVPWRERGVEIVIECSGKFRSRKLVEPLFAGGVRKVLVAAPVKEEALNVVMGCNDHLYDHQHHDLLTAASCTTNCLGPIVKVLHETIGIRHGSITTIHDATNTQVIVDSPRSASGEEDLRRCRSALTSLIPTTTGSASAIGLIYPELEGKLSGLAVRVPLLNASLLDCAFEVARPTSVEEVNAALQEAANGRLEGILGFERRPLVSADYVNDRRSGIIDGPSTMVLGGTQVKVLAWYDNETGYVHRLLELARKVAQSLAAASQPAA